MMVRNSLVMLSLFLISCGSQPSSDIKIVGGESVTDNDILTRSTVALLTPEGRSFCTGTLVGSRHVITAGHCLMDYDEEKLVVFFGSKAIPEYIVDERLREASQATMHEEFNRSALKSLEPDSPPNDIAILTLEEDAPEAFSAPVPMLTAEDKLQIGDPLTLAGYGYTDYRSKENGILYKVGVELEQERVDAREIIYGSTDGKSACRGDSGGPAYYLEKGGLYLLGVTSRGSMFCNTNGVYTDVRHFNEWVAKTTRDSVQGQGYQ